MKIRSLCVLFCFLLLTACSDPEPGTPTELGWKGKHVQTMPFGADDNSEVIKLLPSGDRAVMVASKSRKITLLEVSPDEVKEVASVKLFAEDASDSELTHIDFDSEGRFAVVTRTLPIVEEGELVDCRGSLVFVDLADDTFGTVLQEVEVGAMPDAVDISPDDRYVVSADEVDYNDGKCPLPEVDPSVTVLEIPNADPTATTVRAVISMVSDSEGARREPEQIIFASDSDHVAVTLQDTHELLLFQLSAVLDADGTLVETSSDQLSVVRLPNRSSGAEPWPDGVHSFVDASGAEYFVVAGEYNDTLTVLDLDGTLVVNHEIQPANMPGDLPRNLESWNHAPFRPDSLASFHYDGHSYIAASLKHAGAVGVWRVDDPLTIQIADVVKIGFDDQGTATTESTIGTEGISASAAGLVLTANEEESSVSLVAPLLSGGSGSE